MKHTPRRAVLYELISKSPTPGGPPIAAPHGGLPHRLRDNVDAPDPDHADEFDADVDVAPRLRVREGRLTVALNPATYIIVAGGLVALMLSAYAVGRSSGRAAGSAAPTMTAVNEGNRTPANPLLDGGTSGALADAAEPPKRSRNDSRPLGAIHPPHTEDPAKTAAPSAASDAKSRPAASEKKPLRLWIESIKTRTAAEKRTAEQEAQRIGAFLAGQGVKSTLVPVENGVIILSEEGFPPGSAGEADREAFKKRIRELGRLYRQQGGRYTFAGCFFRGE